MLIQHGRGTDRANARCFRDSSSQFVQRARLTDFNVGEMAGLMKFVGHEEQQANVVDHVGENFHGFALLLNLAPVGHSGGVRRDRCVRRFTYGRRRRVDRVALIVIASKGEECRSEARGQIDGAHLVGFRMFRDIVEK